ncbi:MAG: DUF6316 family protein [Pseudomonadota bacterium]
MAADKRVTDEQTRKHFRAGRFSVSNGKFYFSTREGTLEGPFDSQGEAERELAVYIRRVSGKDIYGSIIVNNKPPA